LIIAEARLDVLSTWCAESKTGADAEAEFEVLETFKGADLLGRTYEQLLPFVKPEAGKKAFVVVAADFVTLDSGTGIVHMAPAFGEDDYQVGLRENLSFFRPVDANGKFTAEIEPWAGVAVKAADRQIIKHLAESGQLLHEQSYRHDYPYHDRCDNPLIYFATPSWFIKTSAMRDKLVEANTNITWAPPEVGTGRFANWLDGNIDWSLSRNRFWGTPLNVWVCDTCEELHLPTCRDDLSKLTSEDHSELDMHRPYVDDISFGCQNAGCQGAMHRTPEVIDCWFDSGSMPFAQYHYPFENKELFESQFPADFISEGIDQTRGWFYTMLVISTFLMGKSAYKSCLVNELILDNKGKKMSKSVGNTVDPMEIMRTSGADPLRWYMLTSSPVWTTTRFDIGGVKEAQRKILATVENTYNFFTLYANLDGYKAADDGPQELDLLDKWILSRLQSVTERVTADLNELQLTRAAKTLGTFFLDDVSNWYVRLSRRRFWKGEMTPDKRAAFATLFTVLESSARMLAPIIPFTAEEIYRGLMVHQDADSSVHLQAFPTAKASLVDEALERGMAAAQAVVSLGRSLRQECSLKTRQPLGQLLMHANDDRADLLMADPLLQSYICDELNIKAVGTVEDPRQVANLSAKANFRALGPRFGKQAPAAAKVITAMTAAEVLQLREHGHVNLTLADESLEFTFEEVTVVEEGVPPFVAAGNNGLIVAIDTTLTPELKEEGLCRELINKIQNLRKKSGLEVSDRIKLAIEGPEAIMAAVSHFEGRIAGETLAVTVAAEGELAYKDSFEIEDQDISIALDRV